MRLSPLCLIPVAFVTLASCEGNVPPTPRAAWSVTFVDTGVDCAHMGHNSLVGKVTSNRKDAVITDGTDDTDVKCTVSPSGSGYNVDASASRKDLYLNILINGITSGATEAAPALGGLAYSSAITADAYTATASGDTACKYYFIPGSGEGVDKGKIWVAFQCPIVTTEGSTCAIQQGYAIFENCSE